MWYQQIFVALLVAFLGSQQIAAVVNSGQSAKVEDSKNAETSEIPTSSKESDSVPATSEDKVRHEVPIPNAYGPPLSGPADSYLPTGTSNINLPVPVYGVPDAAINNIVYSSPPADILPQISLSTSSYGVPLMSTHFGGPTASASTAYLPNSFATNSLQFDGPLFGKFQGPHRGSKPNYGPPRSQYGPPRKPYNFKHPFKYPYKGGFGLHKHVKPLSIYGPPSSYFKDNYSSSKSNFNFNSQNSLLSNINTLTQNAFAGHSTGGGNSIVSQYGAPNVGYDVPHVDYSVPNVGYGVPNLINIDSNGATDINVEIIPTSLSHGGQEGQAQYISTGVETHGLTKHQYGPPQPISHPKPPHPGVPAPPTPPDIKYDGWQPIPGLISRAPSTSYGVVITGQDHGGDGFNKDLIPPRAESHNQQSSGGFGSIALGNRFNDKQVGISDSYGAPLNTVTGSGGIVSSSGDEVHGQHLSHNGDINIDLGHDVNAVKSIGIDIYPSGLGSVGANGHAQSAILSQDTYGAPPLNSFSAKGPYAAAHSYNSFGNIGSSLNSGSFNTYKSHHKFKGTGSGRGLIPPSGVYGVPPNRHYGTPLFTNIPHSPPLNALKINPPRHPVFHREPVPTGVFDSITKSGFKQGHISNSQSYGSAYLSPPILEVPKVVRQRVPTSPTSLYSLPHSHSSISFQNFAQGSSSAGLLQQNLDAGHSLSSYNVPLNIVDGSYNLPQAHSSANLGGEVVGLDFSHPTVTIDLTQHNDVKGSFSETSDCVHKPQTLPQLSYGVPPANGYDTSSSIITNVGASENSLNSGSTVDISYEATEPHSNGHDYDLSVAHSQKVTSAAKANLIETEKSEGKSYGKTVAQSLGPQSEVIQSQSIDFNNINLQGALGSYTLQIQSADGAQNQVPHDQLLNDELLQSILAAIEQPQKDGQTVRQPIIQVQKSLEKQNFVTNDTIQTVVGKITDSEIEHSLPVQYVVEPSNELHANVTEEVQEIQEGDDSNIHVLQENGIALYFNNKERSKKDTTTILENEKILDATVSNSHSL